MKKFSAVFSVVLVLLLFAGCSGKNSTVIENHKWILMTVQSASNGSVVGVGKQFPEATGNFDTRILDVECTAEDGSFSVTDKTGNRVYEGVYILSSETKDSTVYSVSTHSAVGSAVVSVKKTADDAEDSIVLIITLKDYTLNFVAE